MGSVTSPSSFKRASEVPATETAGKLSQLPNAFLRTMALEDSHIASVSSDTSAADVIPAGGTKVVGQVGTPSLNSLEGREVSKSVSTRVAGVQTVP